MFENLTKALSGVFDGLRGKSRLSEQDVDTALSMIRTALLEADVALPAVRTLTDNIRAKAVGQDIIKAISPADQVVKIVHDELVEALGGADTNPDIDIDLSTKPPAIILMTGLQGSGKTTTTAKLGKYLQEKRNKKVLLASLDTYRPAAQEQLAQVGAMAGVKTLDIAPGENPLTITDRALKTAAIENVDVLILDTAGRLSIDDQMMNELLAIKQKSSPIETLLVADAMTGQDAVTTATTFDKKIGITGLILTRMDGDARGGAALSMRMVTGKSIRMIGVGEKVDALEPFYPNRMAGRILDMGDVVSLVERAAATADAEEAKKIADKFQKGEFDMNDMLSQLRQMKRMGGMNEISKMLPGLSKFSDQIAAANLDDKVLKRQEAIILSMTLHERRKPSVLNASRRRRIASGSGTTVQDVNKLMKQYEQMSDVMKRIKKMGMGGMMNMLKGFMGSKDAAMLDMMQGMDTNTMNAEDIKNMMKNMPNTPGGGLPSGIGPGFPGLPGGPRGGPLGGLLGQLSGKLKK
jgi:signal recognition particle subunit SRP54